jgi:soluble cytochrome b562
MNKGKREIVEYKPPRGIEELDNTQRLTDLVGQTVTIKEVQFFETANLVIAKVILEDGKAYRTTSDVLVKQLREIKKLTDEGKLVKTTLTKRKRYYTFA